LHHPGHMVAGGGLVVTGAGWEEANGLYVPTGRQWHDAPVFENDKKCTLLREPHRNQKTNTSSYGWILGQDRKPLYAVQSENLLPPDNGWRKFNGAAPVPQFKFCESIEAAACETAKSFKDQGNSLFMARRYPEAEVKWTRALELGDQISDETITVALFSNRSEARLRQQKWETALQDANSALLSRPNHDKALLRAAVACREMKRYDEAHEFAMRCIDAHPKQQEAKQLLQDLEQLIEEESNLIPSRAQTAREKLREAIQKEGKEAGLDEMPKKSAKDINSKKNVQCLCGVWRQKKFPKSS